MSDDLHHVAYCTKEYKAQSMKRIVIVLLLPLLTLIACTSSDTGTFVVNDKVKARIDSTLKALVDSGSIAGVSALIYEKDKEEMIRMYNFMWSDINKK